MLITFLLCSRITVCVGVVSIAIIERCMLLRMIYHRMKRQYAISHITSTTNIIIIIMLIGIVVIVNIISVLIDRRIIIVAFAFVRIICNVVAVIAQKQ